MASATLYIVATPIGNLTDMVPRAVEILQQVNTIAAENPRHSQRLAQAFSINTPMVRYHDHSDAKVRKALINQLLAGHSVALISDAGTPLIADPGYRLVNAAWQAGITVIPIPGPCAAITALSAAGLPSDRFVFEGFLSAKANLRHQQLTALQEEPRTMIFYETPHRLLACLKDMASVFGGDRLIVLARELSKIFETMHRAPLNDTITWVSADQQQQRGECVLLVQGFVSNDDAVDHEARRILKLLATELPLKQAAALAARITGVKKNHLYQCGIQNTEDHCS